MSKRERVTVFSVTVERDDEGHAITSIVDRNGTHLLTLVAPEGEYSQMTYAHLTTPDGVTLEHLQFGVYVAPVEPAVAVARKSLQKREGTMKTDEQKQIERAEDKASARAELLLAIEHIEQADLPEDVKAEVVLMLVPAMREYLTDEGRDP